MPPVLFRYEMMNSNQDKRRSARKVDVRRAVGIKFTQFLISNHFVTPQSLKLSKVQLIEYFARFQFKFPCHVRGSEIIAVLRANNFVKKNDGINDDQIEFRKIIFDNSKNTSAVTMEELQKPRIRVFINEGKMFKNSNGKATAIYGLECQMCKVSFNNTDELDKHLLSDVHFCRELYRTAKGKFKIDVDGLDINKITKTLEKDVKNISEVVISNNSKHIFEIENIIPLINLTEVNVQSPAKKMIKPGEVYICKLVACFPRYGIHEYPVVFVVRNSADSSSHKLLFTATYKVLKEEIQYLSSDTPFIPDKKKIIVFEDAPVVSGIPLEFSSKERLYYIVPLRQYPIPITFLKVLRYGFKSDSNFTELEQSMLQKMRDLFCNKKGDEILDSKVALTKFNYVERFKHLLYMEEYQQSRSMLSYNRENVVLMKSENKPAVGVELKLDIPGLSEGRPSVLKGDSLFVRPADKSVKYEGVVHDVRETTVSLVFNKNFNYITKQKVGVEFQLNRMILRICHRAVETIDEENLSFFMFPEKLNTNLRNTPKITHFYNKLIATNDSQRLAVSNIVGNTAHPAPYIVYGPPGTGKTSTLVEAITQLYFLRKDSLKICACAPSNAAANLLASKLVQHVPPSAVLRIFSMSYSAWQVPEELRCCSNFTSVKNNLLFPSTALIKSKTIIIVTPITAGRLYGLIAERYLDYIFFDEAGQAEETLALVPIAGLLKRENEKILGSVVLAGDPKQLGPIIHSLLASHLGFNISMIERLMNTCEPYKKENGAYNANYITKLINNYRSHPALLHLPNKLFYEGELKSHADLSKTQMLCSWEKLPKKNIPMLFHGVKGIDSRDEDSPSYYNLLEITCVSDYLTNLLGSKISGRQLKQEDVVVLTPYRKQVQQFRKYFQKKKWEKVLVSSIEQFQGQERTVVILSCVRSRKEFLPSDYQFGLGFLRNPKRFNVAITRAIALMIIVGNPDVLQCDPHWRELLQYCKVNGCYTGEEADGSVTNLDPNKTLAVDLSALTTKEIPASEKPSFAKDD